MRFGKIIKRISGLWQVFQSKISDTQELRPRMLIGINTFMTAAFSVLWGLYGFLFLTIGYFPEGPDLVFSFVPLLIFVSVFLLINRGHSKLASGVLIGYIIVWISAIGYLEGNPSDDPILILGLLLVVVFAVAVLETKHIWIAIGFAGAAYLVLAVLWLNDFLPPETNRVPIPSILITSFAWAFCAVSIVIIVNSLLKGLKNQKEILEERVLERTKNLENATTETNELNKAMLNMLEDLEESNQLLKDQKEELAVVNRELTSFSYSVSHDLRAPLRAMDGFSRILTEDYAAELSPDAVRYLGLIRRNAQQMGQLIDDLLAYSRSSRVEIRRSITDPVHIVQQVWDELTAERDMAAVEFTQYEMPACYADPLLLKQVYQNLLENALKYSSHRDHSKIDVGFQTFIGSESSVYYVKDNGIGFDMKYADKLFDVFQRLHSDESYEGTGVGLAIVSRIINRHGGKVWAEAQKNQGATFFFTIEREQPDGAIS